ncbi:pinensin family lanthipeptide [Longimicrobium sp.]|uniref:pinensin family lanthipeptide n=1 Tax=Longimicrobium sp. TaxID=2029185 RepID=UPI003B3AB7E9
MKKLTLDLDTLKVQSFETALERAAEIGTVHGFVKKTGIDDTNCSAIDACASARGCTELETCFGCEETNTCESYNDACPTGRGCTPLFPC